VARLRGIDVVNPKIALTLLFHAAEIRACTFWWPCIVAETFITTGACLRHDHDLDAQAWLSK
jgi:hypothetical protein